MQIDPVNKLRIIVLFFSFLIGPQVKSINKSLRISQFVNMVDVLSHAQNLICWMLLFLRMKIWCSINPPIYLSVLDFTKLIFELDFLSVSNLIFTACVAWKNPVQNKLKNQVQKFREIEILKTQVKIHWGSVTDHEKVNTKIQGRLTKKPMVGHK